MSEIEKKLPVAATYYAVGDELINKHTRRVAKVLRVNANGDLILSHPLDRRVRYDGTLITEHWSLHNVNVDASPPDKTL